MFGLLFFFLIPLLVFCLLFHCPAPVSVCIVRAADILPALRRRRTASVPPGSGTGPGAGGSGRRRERPPSEQSDGRAS
eukprot:4699152-Pyramimonas_sp.AAC.1